MLLILLRGLGRFIRHLLGLCRRLLFAAFQLLWIALLLARLGQCLCGLGGGIGQLLLLLGQGIRLLRIGGHFLLLRLCRRIIRVCRRFQLDGRIGQFLPGLFGIPILRILLCLIDFFLRGFQRILLRRIARFHLPGLLLQLLGQLLLFLLDLLLRLILIFRSPGCLNLFRQLPGFFCCGLRAVNILLILPFPLRGRGII